MEPQKKKKKMTIYVKPETAKALKIEAAQKELTLSALAESKLTA